jgi:uncharacterized protein (TIGR03437 family)
MTSFKNYLLPDKKVLFVAIPLIVLTVFYFVFSSRPVVKTSAAIITLDPGTTYQIMTGWEATAQAGQINEVDTATGASNLNPAYPRYKDQLFDLAVSDLGINRIRLEILSGAENPVDYFPHYINGQIGFRDFKTHWYEIINDNDNPFVINPGGFQFADLDFKIESLIIPLKQRLEARGERLYVNLNYVDFGSSAFEHYNMPEEYAEFMSAVFLHMQSKYGFTPQAVEVALEPDNTGFTGTQMGAAIVATGNRLRASGFNPDFIAPSTTCMSSAISWFDEIIAVPGARQFLTELSYHRYCGVSDANLEAIGSRAVQYGINSSHLELIGADRNDLHKDLTLGRNSAWAQYTLAVPFNDGSDNGGQYYLINDSDPNNPKITIAGRTKFLRQYFKFVRPGAIRIKATSSDVSSDPIAFVNTDGKFVVIVKAETGAPITLGGLPAGTYGIKYTTESEYDIDAADITIGSGQTVDTMIPAAGVITIYGKSSSPIVPVNAASYNLATTPGQIVAAFGSGFPASTNISAVSSTTPLPTNLNGVSVKINQTLAPLFFVGVGGGFGAGTCQINFQIPYEIPPGLATISILNNDAPVVTRYLIVGSSAPGLYTTGASGRGQAVALNQDFSLNGNPAENQRAKPESRGRALIIFANGPGGQFINPANGQPLTPVSGAVAPPGGPTYATASIPFVTIGGAPATVAFSGLAPGLIGLWQLNIIIPQNAPTGSAVPLAVSIGGRTANFTTVAVN